MFSPPGGIAVYPEEKLFEEVGFIAYYFHWDEERILNMPHWERIRWCEEISKINKRISSDKDEKSISLLDLL
ncbi:DUF6760 family protein [Persephonella sp.]